jgi:lipid II:glycine glycyltransferase (peptidoglycan interpeptide bridge formation enzyme)
MNNSSQLNNIFLTEEWLDYFCSHNPFMKKNCVKISTGFIYFAEIKRMSIKIWYLFGELDRKQFEELISIGKLKDVDIIESSFNMARWSLDTIKGIADIIWEYGTYEIDLTLNEQILWKNMHRKHRKSISEGLKNGVIIKDDISPKDFEKIMKETYGPNRRTIYNKELYINAKKYLGKNLLIGSAWFEDDPQSIVVIYYNKNKAYEIIKGTKKNPHSGATSLLIWEMIKKLKKMEVKIFDLGGARKETSNPILEGIFRFKRHFGGNFLECYYSITKVSLFKATLFILLRKLRSFLLYKKFAVFR